MGKITEKFEENKTKDQRPTVLCPKCNRGTNHIVRQSLDCNGSEVVGYFREDPQTIDWFDNYQIIQCQGCNNVSFRHINWFSELEDFESNGITEILYPKRSSNMRPTKDYYNVPISLRRIYRETIDCFNNEAFTLSAAGLRAIIEGICAEQGIKNGPVKEKQKDGSIKIVRKKILKGKIAGLEEKGILTSQATEILHEHRFLGNSAIHELDQPSTEELVLAIDILEHTLDALYEMPDKADELRQIKQRRLKKKEK